MKQIFFLFCVLMVGLSYAQSPIKQIRFATEATYPPFEYVDGGNQIKGFDIDLANAICQQLKVECSFAHQSFYSLIQSLKIGKFDAVISALGITKEREKQVDFTGPYYQPSATFVAAINKHYQLKDLPGKTIAVQTGSTFEKYIQEKYGDRVVIKNYTSIQDAFLDLKASRVDLVIADKEIAKAWLNVDSNTKNFIIVEKPIIDEKYFGSGYGIAVSKNNTALLKQLNDALMALKANGEYEKIAGRYFSPDK
jgi:arginine transport system substrate-binding protein